VVFALAHSRKPRAEAPHSQASIETLP
jgi:hypothetical protein